MDSKPCEQCGALIYDPKHKRKTCSVRCRSDARRDALMLAINEDPKTCKQCNRTYYRKITQSPPKWRRSKFCSVNCLAEFNRTGMHLKGSNGEKPTCDRALLIQAVSTYGGSDVAASLNVTLRDLRKWHDKNGEARLRDDDRERLKKMVDHARTVGQMRPGVPDDGRDVTELGVPLYTDRSERSVWAVRDDMWEVW